MELTDDHGIGLVLDVESTDDFIRVVFVSEATRSTTTEPRAGTQASQTATPNG
jgi:hypothetical protein